MAGPAGVTPVGNIADDGRIGLDVRVLQEVLDSDWIASMEHAAACIRATNGLQPT